jgi:predicted negative regulator of RcsB-dependent stress response
MTAPVIRDPSDRDETVLDWLQINSKYLITGAVIVAVAAAAYWFYIRSAEMRQDRASRDLLTAKQSMVAGNPALATTDLQRVITRYGNTTPGVEAALVLAELRYEAGEFDAGMAVLREVADRRAAEPMRSRIHSLIGDGHVQAGNLDEAAAAYQRAAESARFDGQRAFEMAKRGRTLMAAGKIDEARSLWQELATAPWAEQVAPEAQVRLGELQAAPIGG